MTESFNIESFRHNIKDEFLLEYKIFIIQELLQEDLEFQERNKFILILERMKFLLEELRKLISTVHEEKINQIIKEILTYDEEIQKNIKSYSVFQTFTYYIKFIDYYLQNKLGKNHNIDFYYDFTKDYLKGSIDTRINNFAELVFDRGINDIDSLLFYDNYIENNNDINSDLFSIFESLSKYENLIVNDIILIKDIGSIHLLGLHNLSYEKIIHIDNSFEKAVTFFSKHISYIPEINLLLKVYNSLHRNIGKS